MKKLDGSMRRDSIWKVDDGFDCVVCSDMLYLPVTTACGHNFCKPCLKDVRNTSDFISNFYLDYRKL